MSQLWRRIGQECLHAGNKKHNRQNEKCVKYQKKESSEPILALLLLSDLVDTRETCHTSYHHLLSILSPCAASRPTASSRRCFASRGLGGGFGGKTRNCGGPFGSRRRDFQASADVAMQKMRCAKSQRGLDSTHSTLCAK